MFRTSTCPLEQENLPLPQRMLAHLRRRTRGSPSHPSSSSEEGWTVPETLPSGSVRLLFPSSGSSERRQDSRTASASNLHEETRVETHIYSAAGRVGRVKEFEVHGVHRREVFGSGEVDAHAQHVTHAGSSRRQGGTHIFQRLTGLRLHTLAGLTGGRIHAHLTRRVHERPNTDCMRVGSGGGRGMFRGKALT